METLNWGRQCDVICAWISKEAAAALIGRPGSSCLVTPLDDAIHTCCDEKFKPTCELFAGKDSSMRYRCVPRHKVFGEAAEASIKRSTAEFCLQPPVSTLAVRLPSVWTPTGANISGWELFFFSSRLCSVACSQMGRCFHECFRPISVSAISMKPSWGCELCNSRTLALFFYYLSTVLLLLLHLGETFTCV